MQWIRRALYLHLRGPLVASIYLLSTILPILFEDNVKPPHALTALGAAWEP